MAHATGYNLPSLSGLKSRNFKRRKRSWRGLVCSLARQASLGKPKLADRFATFDRSCPATIRSRCRRERHPPKSMSWRAEGVNPPRRLRWTSDRRQIHRSSPLKNSTPAYRIFTTSAGLHPPLAGANNRFCRKVRCAEYPASVAGCANPYAETYESDVTSLIIQSSSGTHGRFFESQVFAAF